MTDAGIPMGLKPCPICNKQPKRNGRFRTGGVLCAGPLNGFPAHRVQTYGPTQEEADLAWNTRAFADTPPPAAAGDRSLAREAIARALYEADDFDPEVDPSWEEWRIYANDRPSLKKWVDKYYRFADAILALRTPEPNSGGEADHG
jgi:hypothetical protein